MRSKRWPTHHFITKFISNSVFGRMKEMIRKLHAPTPEQLEAAARIGQPLIITGLIDGWNIMDWTPDYLADKFPNYSCDIAFSVLELMGASKYRKVPLRKFVDLLKKVVIDPTSDKNFYLLESRGFLANTKLEKVLEDEIEDYRLPGYVNYLGYLCTNTMFLGPKGSRTGFHTDDDHRNYLCVVHGRKKLWLAPPSETPYMYRSPKYEFGGMTSVIDRWNVDHRKYPLYRKAKIVLVVLEAGDMVYIPRQWWHAAENLSPCSAVGWRYETLPTLMTKHPLQMVKRQLHEAGLYKKGNCTCCTA